MSDLNRRNKKRKKTRADKVSESFEPMLFRPRTQGQATYANMIRKFSYVLATGYAGTGKTYVPCRIAADMFKRGLIKHIVFIRPALSQSASLGFFKGSKEEKMEEWLKPIKGALMDDFSYQEFQYNIKPEVGNFVFCPLETVKGNSFKDSFVIVDEAEDITVKELKSLLTRLGENSKMVLCGDTSQSDLRQENGLRYAVEAYESNNLFRSVVGNIDFCDVEDIVRSEDCSTIIQAFNELEAA